MCFSGPKVDTSVQDAQLEESRLARQKEEERQARINAGTQAINSQFAQFDDAYYGKRSQSYLDYYQPQLDDKFALARKDLTYALARAGTLNSTAAADKNAELTKQYGQQSAAIQAKAAGEADTLRTSVQNNKSALVNQLNTTGDADAAANAATAATKQIFNQVPAYNPLGDIFSGIASGIGGLTSYYNNQQILSAGGVNGANRDSSTTIP